MSMGYTIEWDDWYAYQHAQEVATSMLSVAQRILENGRESVKEDTRDYMTREFVSLLDGYGVPFEVVVRQWLRRQVYQQKMAEEHAEQVIAALDLLTAEPKQEHCDSDIPIHGIIS